MNGIADMRSALFGLVGMFFGGLLTWIVISPAQAESDASGSAVFDELLAAQLRSEALLQDIAATSPTIGGPGAPVPRREAAGEATPEALVERLASLDETLTRLVGALGGSGGPAGAVSTPLVYDPARLPATEVLEAMQARPAIDVNLAHLGWTLQKVLDVYGRPGENWTTSEAVENRWFYDTGTGGVTFYFIDGRVVQVVY